MNKFLLALIVSVTLINTSLYAMEAREDQHSAPTASKIRRPRLPTPPGGIAKLPLAHGIVNPNRLNEREEGWIAKLGEDNFNYLMRFLKPKSIRVVAKSAKNILSRITPNIKSVRIGAILSCGDPLVASDDFLKTMTNLTYLHLAHKHNQTDEALAPLKNLKILQLANSAKITDISGLSSLTRLIIERNNSITDISLLTNLKYLDLGYNEEVKDEGISSLTNLESLSLAGKTKISINGLTNLKNLRHLSLSTRDFTDEELNKLPALTSLNLVCCSFTQGQLLKLPSLINLEFGHQSDISFTNFHHLTTLESLNLPRKTYVRDQDLETLTNLKTLVLNNRDSHVTSQSISRLINLTYLKCCFLRLTDEAMQQLTQLKTLVPGMDGLSYSSLSSLRNLTYLDCSGNSKITTETLIQHPSLKEVRMECCPQINAEELNKKGIVTFLRPN